MGPVVSVSTSNQTLDGEMRRCRRCAIAFAKNPIDPRRSLAHVEPRPIVTGIRTKPVMLIGQAPGLTEYETGKPFQGDAGKGIRAIFAALGIAPSDFDDLVYSSAVIKCFPGSKSVLRAGKVREDILPTAEMIRNCQPFLGRQIRLVDPQVLVTLGGLPLKAYLKLTGRSGADVRLENYIGQRETWNSRTVVFFPHTSGASRWLNSPGNRQLLQQAKTLLRVAFIERGITT